MRSKLRIAAFAALAGCWLLSASSSEAAPPIDGKSHVLKIDGKPNLGPQNILVIPVVDSTFTYDANARQMETSFPGQRGIIERDYGRMASYWSEASYGIVTLSSEVANCFYQIPVEFPNVGEEAYLEANVKGAPRFFYEIKYSRLVVDYVADPALPSQKKTFTGDPNLAFTTVEDFLAHLNAQVAATEGIEATFDGNPATLSGKLVFRIKRAESRPGSSVSFNYAESDITSRRAVGFVKPTVTTTLGTGRVVVRTESAALPSRIPSSIGQVFAMNLSGAAGGFDSFHWDITKADGTPNTCSSLSDCPSYDGATQLSQFLRPQGSSIGSIRDVNVDGFPELEFEVQLSQTATDFTAVTATPEIFSSRLGLDSVQAQVGKGFGREKTPQGAATLTSAALQALLNAELSSDLGCLATELADQLAADGNTKGALDTYLDRFDAIHTLLLTDTNEALRANATLDPTPLDVNLTIGAATFPYQILADITAVNLVNGAATIAHEVGHNIGFPDLYDLSTTFPDFVTDFHPNLTWMGSWDMMADQSAFPHTGAFNKQSFHNWISGAEDNGKVVTVAPGTDKNYLITPLEYASSSYDDAFPLDANGQRVGPGGEEVVKVLILPFGDEVPAPGKSVPPHFIAVENRQEKPADPDPMTVTFNTSLPNDGGIHVTDNLSDLRMQGADFKPINRQYTHSLVAGPFYPDTNGAPVALGSTLDTAATFPAYPGITINPIMTVAAPDPTKPPSILVRVAYTTTERLDLKIEPWNAPKEYATKSIWFERATSATPPVEPALPSQTGNVVVPIYRDGYDPAANGGVPLNWIHVYVENTGTFAAEEVKLKAWFNSPGAIGDADYWQVLEVTAGKSIPVDGHTVFSIPWSPGVDVGSNQHTCIAVEVHSWKVGAFGQVADINPFNNLAQENVHKMEMTTNSPWHDVPFKVEVHNSFAQALTVKLEPQGLLPGYSVALDQPSVLMDAKSSQVFTGSLRWDSTTIPVPSTQNPYDPYWQACNVSATGGIHAPTYCGGTWSLTAYANLGDAQVPLGGVSFETEGKPTATLTSSATNSANGDVVVTGQVLPPYRGQIVRIVVKYPSGRQDTVEVPTFAGGTFVLPFTPRERGPLVITTELPRGTWPNAPFAPTEPTEIAIEACAPTTPSPPQATCNDGLLNGTETGIDCGGLTCSPCGGSGIVGELVIESDWGTGYCAVVKVRNLGSVATSSWNVALNTLQSTLYTNWNGNFSANTGNISVTSLSWNAAIAPGAAVTSAGFCADRNAGSTSTAQVISASGTF